MMKETKRKPENGCRNFDVGDRRAGLAPRTIIFGVKESISCVPDEGGQVYSLNCLLSCLSLARVIPKSSILSCDASLPSKIRRLEYASLGHGPASHQDI